MNRLLTVADVARYCGLHVNTVYRLVKKAELPHIKLKGRVRFKEGDIDAWLNDHSSKVFPLLEPLTQIDLALDSYDRLFLKGGVKMNPKGKTWNYPFGSVYLRQSRWYFYFRFQGKRIRKVIEGALSRADALKVLQVEVADAFRGKHGFKKEEKKIKFSDFAELYLENYAKVNKRSWKDDAYSIRRLNEFFDSSRIHDITPFDLERFKTERLKEGISKARVNRNLALLKKMFNLAIDWGHLKESPARKVRLFSEKDNLKERILTAEEEERLLRESSEHLRPILVTALHSGMRRGEILSLEWHQVDLTRRTIRVEKTKSGRIRIIPVNDLLFDELMSLKKKDGKAEHVFLNPRTGKPIGDVKTAFNAAKRRAGIKGLRFHDLRHSFASRLIALGVDLITVKDLLGHHSVTVTQRYTHSNAEQKRKAVENLALTEANPFRFVPNLSTRLEGRGLNALFTAN